jgi:hypothetical protein
VKKGSILNFPACPVQGATQWNKSLVMPLDGAFDVILRFEWWKADKFHS